MGVIKLSAALCTRHSAGDISDVPSRAFAAQLVTYTTVESENLSPERERGTNTERERERGGEVYFCKVSFYTCKTDRSE